MGCSNLYHLAEAGVSDAILLERNRLTSGTTWHSAAQVRALRSTRNLTDLIRYSVSLYARLEAETGQATGWINKGSLSIATSEDRLVHIRRQEALAHLFGARARSIAVDEARERWPLMNAEDVIGAVWSPDDGRVSPSDLCAALAARAPEVLGKHYEITYPGRQWATGRRLRSTPLDDVWRAENAHFGQVFGFERPLCFGATQEPALTFGKPAWFDQVGREVRQAHERAAVFRVALPAYPDRPDGHGEISTIPSAHIECAALTPHRRWTRVHRPRADAQAPTQSCR